MSASLHFSPPHVLRNDTEYQAAHAEVIALLDQDPAPDSVAGERLEFLTVLIAAYDAAQEAMHGSMSDPPPTPQEVVEFALAQRGETRADLHALIGGKARVSEFFARKRPLSMGQVQALRDHFTLPADLLVPPKGANGPLQKP